MKSVKQTNKQTSKILLLASTVGMLLTMCSKDQIEKPPLSETSQIASTVFVTNNNYAIFTTQEQFETAVLRAIDMSEDELAAYVDSLNIVSLRENLLDSDTLYEGIKGITSVLNKDGIIQIGDSIILIDKPNDKAYILTPANPDYLGELRNKQLVDGYIFLHETLDKPVLEHGDIDGIGKKGIFCRDGWARERQDIGHSWDDYWNVSIPVSNGTMGMQWKLRYATFGLWYSLTVNAKMVELNNNRIVGVVNGGRYPVRHTIDVQWSRRCGNSHHSTNTMAIGWGLNNVTGETIYSNPRALQRYSLSFWAQHSITSGGTLFNCVKWPLHIADTR